MINRRSAIIIEAKAYPKQDTERPLYRKLLDLGPGGMYVSRQYNSALCHILARGGGCVAIRSIAIDGAVIAGPGRVTAALGLTIPKTIGQLRETRNGSLVIDVNTPNASPLPQSQPISRTSNGIGETVLARFMPQLVRRWLSRSPKTRGSFPHYLKEVLRTCSNARELRRLLT